MSKMKFPILSSSDVSSVWTKKKKKYLKVNVKYARLQENKLYFFFWVNLEFSHLKKKVYKDIFSHPWISLV
jgi:hypothetical protein